MTRYFRAIARYLSDDKGPCALGWDESRMAAGELLARMDVGAAIEAAREEGRREGRRGESEGVESWIPGPGTGAAVLTREAIEESAADIAKSARARLRRIRDLSEWREGISHGRPVDRLTEIWHALVMLMDDLEPQALLPDDGVGDAPPGPLDEVE